MQRKSTFCKLCNCLSYIICPNLKVQTVAPIINKVNATRHSMKAGTGACKHFITKNDKNRIDNLRTLQHGPSALLPNSVKIFPSHIGDIPFTNISTRAKEALVYPDINNSSLLSIRQLCDDKCTAIFTRTHMFVKKK